MRRLISRAVAVGLAGVLVAIGAAASDLEVRKEMAAPGALEAVLPVSDGVRSLMARLATPPGASVSALVEWTPADRELTVILAAASNPERPISTLKGRSPIAIGTRVESGGAMNLVVTDPAGGAESVVIRATINWAVSPSSPVNPSARRDPGPAPAQGGLAESARTASDPVRIVELSWREDGDLSVAAVRRDGLTMRLSGPVNPELARKAVRFELGFPGRGPGLLAFEEVQLDLRILGDRIVLFLPPRLGLAEAVSARLFLDGDRLLGRNGLFVDADGSGLTLPSGDGRPGGVFRSSFRLVP